MISQWVKVDDDMNVTFDDNAVKEYIQSLAAKYDTKGKERTLHPQVVTLSLFLVEATAGRLTRMQNIMR
mgnify:CR=1 FL=1